MAEQNTADTELAEDGTLAEIETTDLDTTDPESDSEQVLNADNTNASAQGVINKVQKLVDNGETVPRDLQWALKHIETPVRDESTDDLDAKLEAWDSRKQFDSNKAYLESLPQETKNKIINEANELKNDLGVSIDKALARTLKLNKETIEQEESNAIARRSGAILPSSGNAAKGSSISLSDFSNLPADERARLWDQRSKGEITIN